MSDSELDLEIALKHSIGLEKREIAKSLNIDRNEVQESLSRTYEKYNLKNGRGFAVFFFNKIKRGGGAMKKIVFVSRMQFAFCIVLALMSVACFIGMLFNPFHIFTFVMSVVLAVVIYLEKSW